MLLDEIFDISNDLKPSFEGSEFAENLTGNDYDDWYDIFQEDELIPLLNQRALPGETYALDETEKTPLLPDYTVTDEDMHDYGYTKDEMLPLHKRAAQRLWGFGLEINILSHDNTEKAVERLQYGKSRRKIFGTDTSRENALRHQKRGLEELSEQRKNFAVFVGKKRVLHGSIGCHAKGAGLCGRRLHDQFYRIELCGARCA